MCSLLKKFVPIPKIEDFEKYLFVAPHPDDIEVGCAPTVAKLVKLGKKVSFLIVTDGSAGTSDKALYGEKIAKIRQAEQMESAKLLGVTDVTFLSFLDGGTEPIAELVKGVAAAIVRTDADIVFAPDPCVISECHPDHLRVGRATTDAVMMSQFLATAERMGLTGIARSATLAYYYTDKPNSYIGISDTFDMREKCLLCHKSQFTKEAFDQLAAYFKLRSIKFGLRRFKGKCDGYRVLAPTHQHCFPEASDWTK